MKLGNVCSVLSAIFLVVVSCADLGNSVASRNSLSEKTNPAQSAVKPEPLATGNHSPTELAEVEQAVKKETPSPAPVSLPSANPANAPESKTPEQAENKNQNKSKSEQNFGSGELQDQEALDQALELFTQSKVFWEKGDIDNALKCLDDAYSFILDVNGDPDVARQKDDLRLMISKRILEMSATRHVVTPGTHSEIPMILNEDVQREIRSFQTVERNFFIRAYQRSAAFRPQIVKFLKEAGLPVELSWLPLVESGFNVTALSRARALGLWQFIPSTGYKYTLQRDKWIDERMDVDKSTNAAIAYLKELHDIFGDWLTCLAGYNCGEGRVIRVISKQHINYLDHFWDLYRQLPTETARYVPRFLATLHIVKNPAKYGFDLQPLPETLPLPHETVKTNKCMRIQDIATALSISKDALCMMNSELRFQMTPDRDYNFKVPLGSATVLSSQIDKIPEWESPKPPPREFSRRGTHRVKKGESLASIARRYRVSIGDLIDYNNMEGKRIKVGQRLKIPGKVSSATGKKVKVSSAAADPNAGSEIVRYKVKSGDTLAGIARKFNATVAQIKNSNGLKGNKLAVGKVLKIPQHAVAKADTEKR